MFQEWEAYYFLTPPIIRRSLIIITDMSALCIYIMVFEGTESRKIKFEDGIEY